MQSALIPKLQEILGGNSYTWLTFTSSGSWFWLLCCRGQMLLNIWKVAAIQQVRVSCRQIDLRTLGRIFWNSVVCWSFFIGKSEQEVSRGQPHQVSITDRSWFTDPITALACDDDDDDPVQPSTSFIQYLFTSLQAVVF